MRVQLDPPGNNSSYVASVSSNAPSSSRAASRPAPQTASQETPGEAQKPAPRAAAILQANVTFRRAANGQIYYVVTDAQSGKELRQIPAEAVRKVGEGIEEYLQKQGAKPNSHVQVKA